MWNHSALDAIRLYKRRPTRAYAEWVEHTRDLLETAMYPVLARHLRRAKQGILDWATTVRKQADPAMPEYWGAWNDALAADLQSTLAPVLAGIYGTEVSLSVSPPVGFVASDEAVADARTYSYNLVTDMDAAQQGRLQTQLSGWFANDEDIRSLQNRIEGIFGTDRADLIATTEATRINSQARAQFYGARGIQKLEWRTVRDWVVCPECRKLDGKKLTWPWGPGDMPPLHPGCRCNTVPWEEGDINYNRRLFPKIPGAVPKVPKPAPGRHSPLPTTVRPEDAAKAVMQRLAAKIAPLQTRIAARENELNEVKARMRVIREQGLNTVQSNLETSRLYARLHILDDELAGLRADAGRIIQDEVAVPEALRVDITPKYTRLSAEQVETVDKGIAEWRKYVPQEIMDRETALNPGWDNINFVKTSNRGNFDMANWGDTTGRVGPTVNIGARYGPDESVYTVVHELGHAIECGDPEIYQALHDFLDDRCRNIDHASRTGKEWQKLGLYPEIWCDSNYYFRPDSLPWAYAGKSYLSYMRSTELLSMAIEAIVKEPYHFFAADPQYFQLVLQILRTHVSW